MEGRGIRVSRPQTQQSRVQDLLSVHLRCVVLKVSHPSAANHETQSWLDSGENSGLGNTYACTRNPPCIHHCIYETEWLNKEDSMIS